MGMESLAPMGECGMNFGMQRTMRPDSLCIAVAGEVDAYTAPEMRAQLLDALRLHPVVTVDLSAVTFMDSQGLAALLRARQEAESSGGSLRLEGVPPRVLKLLQLTRLDSVFTIDSISPEH
jgi:anti-sigma B factor antagonist